MWVGNLAVWHNFSQFNHVLQAPKIKSDTEIKKMKLKKKVKRQATEKNSKGKQRKTQRTK